MPLTLTDIQSGYNLAAINANFTAIEEAWDEKLDRLENSQDNSMYQELDMNGNDILNATVGGTPLDTVLEDAQEATDAANEAAALAEQAAYIAFGNDVGDYESEDTLSEVGDYVVYERGTTPSYWKVALGVALPYTPDTTTYPTPDLDPNLAQYNDITSASLGNFSDYQFATIADMTAGTTLGGVTVAFVEGMTLSVQGAVAFTSGGGFRYVVGTSQVSETFDVDLGDGLWANRVFDYTHDGSTIYIADYIAAYSDNVEAIKAAFADLYNLNWRNKLEGGGVPIEVEEPVIIDSSLITTGAGYQRVSKHIDSLNIRAGSSIAYTSGDALVYIGVDYGEAKVRHLYITDLTVDIAKNSGLNGLQLQNYYNIFLTRPNIRGILDGKGLVVTRAIDPDDSDNLDAGHGLTIRDPFLHSDFADRDNGQTGMYTEDGDVFVMGGVIEWVETGIDSTNGNFHVSDIHFSDVPVAVNCDRPKVISIKNCDFDNGGYINITDNNQDPDDLNWTGIHITGNEFTITSGDELPANKGLVTFTTGQEDNTISGLVIDDNTVVNSGTGQADATRFVASGDGNWSDFVGILRWPQISANVNPQNGDRVSNILGGSYNTGRKVYVDEDGQLALEDDTTTTRPAINSSGNNLVFQTNNVDKLVLDSGGNFAPLADDARFLGSATFRWEEIFAANDTINTSDEDAKTLESITDTEKAVALAIKDTIRKFKWNASIEENGYDGARIHFGVGAQTVQTVFEEAGLDPDDYSLFCYDAWDEVLDKDGNVLAEAGGRYGIRYGELCMFILSAMD